MKGVPKYTDLRSQFFFFLFFFYTLSSGPQITQYSAAVVTMK